MTSPKRNALGKGLSALLESNSTDITTYKSQAVGSVTRINIADIEANPFQPRTQFDPQLLNELADSIRIHGVIQPITVRKMGYDKYQIISGERRTRASILAGLTEIPAYIRIANDQEMLEMALIENIQRKDLNAIEVAWSYKRLMDECSLKMEELGERVGKDRSTVNNYLRLLKLPEPIQAALRDEQLSMGHARAIIALDDANRQLALYHQITTQDLSVRAIEQLVKTEKSAGSSASAKSAKPNPIPAQIEETRDLSLKN
jgi:ParB family chromosome partitioning protein